MTSSSQHLIVMGVSGSGKTTIAELLTERLGWAFAEADDFHPPANIEKMSAGIPLTDEDRWPWLRTIAEWLSTKTAAGQNTVVTCSALRRVYRDLLREGEGQVRFVHLTGTMDTIESRLDDRSGHFMPAALLGSQFDTLEPLDSDEDGVVVSIDAPPEKIADEVMARLGITA